MGMIPSRGSKRRARRAERKTLRRRHSEYWIWATIFIFALLFTDFFFGRLVTIFSMTATSCMSQVERFGAAAGGISFHELGMWLAVSFVVIWGTLSYIYRDVIWNSRARYAHIAIGLAALFLLTTMRMVQGEQRPVADGSLTVEKMAYVVNAPDENFYVAMNKLARPHPAAGTEIWMQKFERASSSSYRSLPNCIWLNENIVRNETYSIDYSEYLSLIERDHLNPLTYPDWPEKPNYPSIIAKTWLDRYDVDQLRETEIYRELLPAERVRFMIKQACIDERMSNGLPVKSCDWELVYIERFAAVEKLECPLSPHRLSDYKHVKSKWRCRDGRNEFIGYDYERAERRSH